MNISILLSILIGIALIVFLLSLAIKMFRTRLKFKPQIVEQEEKANRLGIGSNYLGGIFEEKDYQLEDGEKIIKYYPGILSIQSHRIYSYSGPITVSVAITKRRIILPRGSFRTKGDSPTLEIGLANDKVSIYFSEDKNDSSRILFRKAEQSRYFWIKKGVILFVLIRKKGLEPSYIDAYRFRKLEREEYILDMNWFFPKDTSEFLAVLQEAQNQNI